MDNLVRESELQTVKAIRAGRPIDAGVETTGQFVGHAVRATRDMLQGEYPQAAQEVGKAIFCLPFVLSNSGAATVVGAARQIEQRKLKKQQGLG